MGFDAKWGVLGAADIGAPHQRDRIWIVGKQMGNTYNNGPITSEISKSLAQRSDSSSTQQEQTSQLERSSEQHGQVAYTTKQRLQREQRKKFEGHGNGFANKGKDVAYTASIRQQRQGKHEQPINSAQSRNRKANYVESIGRPDQWATEPDLGRVANGVAARVDRLKAIGNGQVPLCAATAWKLLTGEMK
jgi:DNA (cytosine-5)-methyltransferase 1